MGKPGYQKTTKGRHVLFSMRMVIGSLVQSTPCVPRAAGYTLLRLILAGKVSIVLAQESYTRNWKRKKPNKA